MTGIIKNFYVNGNTARGFTSLFDSSLQNLQRLFILREGPAAERSNLIRSIADDMVRDGYDIWLLHCPFDNDLLDGLIVPSLQLGIVDGTLPRAIDPALSGAAIQYIHFGEAADAEQLYARTPEIEILSAQITEAYERAYAGFAEALRIHDDWETVYIQNMNFQAADELTESYIDTFYGDNRLDKESRVDHRFLGAATPKGSVDFVPNLTEGVKRYLVKGRAGSGKSTMLKKIAAAGVERGFNVEIYHCGFDPNSLDMVIVRELGFAIFDSTAPHEYFPDRTGDEIIDMYDSCIKPGTDEAYSDTITEIKNRYAAQIKTSVQQLALAKSLQDEREQIYTQAIDFNQVEQIKNKAKQAIGIILAATR
ncbi:PRK06851 family protein [Bacillus sp. FJAT-28004]|uniref:PRK06851 family protein n=1 Tax=Bacillus sp. FJAT-28004 TaxID=1679165 RepID=UPI0006B47BB5|nr:PRK06851 family protein [Bacillus sp. FJAT-28004]